MSLISLLVLCYSGILTHFCVMYCTWLRTLLFCAVGAFVPSHNVTVTISHHRSYNLSVPYQLSRKALLHNRHKFCTLSVNVAR